MTPAAPGHKVHRIRDEMFLDAREPSGVLHIDGEGGIVIIAPLAWWAIRIDDAPGEFIEPETIGTPQRIVLDDANGIGEGGVGRLRRTGTIENT
jgi:hypothetical protein